MLKLPSYDTMDKTAKARVSPTTARRLMQHTGAMLNGLLRFFLYLGAGAFAIVMYRSHGKPDMGDEEA